ERGEWERFTRGSREVPVQARAEIQRRYPNQKLEPLKSAEPSELDLSRPDWLQDLEAKRAAFREELERRKGLEIPDEDPDMGSKGGAWPMWQGQREAILQPPNPEIQPAEGVRELARERGDA